MITYTILEKTETEVTLQIEDSTQWSLKKEKDIKVKKMAIVDATAMLTKTKTQKQQTLQFVTEKVNTEIQNIDSVVAQL
jgi:predicted metal-dependent RNase